MGLNKNILLKSERLGYSKIIAVDTIVSRMCLKSRSGYGSFSGDGGECRHNGAALQPH